MKKLISKLMTKVFIVITILTITLSCSKKEEEVVPKTADEELTKKITTTNIPGSIAQLVTEVTPGSETETSDGYKFEGSIGADIENVGVMDIADGAFEYTIDANNKITSITGVGTAKFPNVGIFEKLQKDFIWEKIKAHIEYKKGSFYKYNYKTDIPLNDERKYLHYQVFDEESGKHFELKHIGNLIVYKFQDLYIDLEDPAIFFKTQIPWPEGEAASEASTNIVAKLWDKVTQSTPWTYADSPGLIIGLSNQATIKSDSYDFGNAERFEDLFGYSSFDEIDSHSYMKLSGIPLPPIPVLTFTGEMYTHRLIDIPVNGELDPEEQQQAVIDWFTQKEVGPYAHTFSGSIDFGGEGIGLVLSILQGLDEVVGNNDILNNDFDIDMAAATFQTQYPDLNNETPAFFRFGGQIKKPMLADLFGENISKYIPSQPTPTGFLYVNIGDELDKWSIYVESTTDMMIPFIGKTEFTDSYFLIKPDGIRLEGKLDLPTIDGIFNFDRSFSGTIGEEGYELNSEYNREINLPNGIVLTSRNSMLHVSSEDGLSMSGSIDMPLGIKEADYAATINKEKAAFEGNFSQGLDLGYGFDLPSRAMTFKTSTDPSEGISYIGEMEVPHIGYNKISGIYNTTEFNFTGEVDRTIDFNGVNLPTANGHLSINSDGISFGGSYSLPFGLKTAQMNGSISREEIMQSGSMSTGISIAGTTFKFSNSYIRASSLTGVKLGGNINLKVFTTKVDGEILPGGNFRLTGSHTYNSKFLVTKINVVVTQAGINLSGTGTIYGVIGNKLASGKITFKPNWAAGTISACINGYCVDL